MLEAFNMRLMECERPYGAFKMQLTYVTVSQQIIQTNRDSFLFEEAYLYVQYLVLQTRLESLLCVCLRVCVYVCV